MTFKDITDQDILSRFNRGELGIIPIDTQYCIAAKASDPVASSRLYIVKARKGKQGTVIAANIDQLVRLGIPKRYLTAVQSYWPGPVSVIIPCGPELAYLHLGEYTLAVRIPDKSELNKLLQQTGPLLTTSANLPGDPPAPTAQAAEEIFRNQVQFYVDGGDYGSREPATIIRIVDDAVEVLRQGAVKIGEDGQPVKQ
jgi:L-threonylcarbamoyladenylate synthase